MTEFSMWDAPAEEIKAVGAKHSVRLAQAAVEPLWPFLAQASTMPDFEHRVALSQDAIARSISSVVTDEAMPHDRLLMASTSALRERFAQTLKAKEDQCRFEASLRAAVASGSIQWTGDTHLGVGFIVGLSTDGNVYEVYFNPNNNPTPCTWAKYGPEGDTGLGSQIARADGFATMQEAMRAAEQHAAGKTSSSRGAVRRVSQSRVRVYEGTSMEYERDESDGPDLQTLTYLIGKYVAVVFFNEHGVAADHEVGRILKAHKGGTPNNLRSDLPVFEWQADGASDSYPIIADQVYRIERLEEPVDPGQTMLFSSRTAVGENGQCQQVIDGDQCTLPNGHSTPGHEFPSSPPQIPSPRAPRDRESVEAKMLRWAAAEDWIDVARRVVQNHQHENFNGTLLDAYSASMLVQVYDALNEANKAKFSSMPLGQAVNMALKLVSKSASKIVDTDKTLKTAVGIDHPGDLALGDQVEWIGPEPYTVIETGLGMGMIGIEDEGGNGFYVGFSDLTKISNLSVCPVCEGDTSTDCEACSGRGVKTSRRTATRYCPTHKVYVGEGNQEQHDHCPVETRKAKDSAKGHDLPDLKGEGDVKIPAPRKEPVPSRFSAKREVVQDSGGRRYVKERKSGMEFRYYEDGSVTILDSSKKPGTNGTIGHTGPNPDRIPDEFRVPTGHEASLRGPAVTALLMEAASDHDTRLPGGQHLARRRTATGWSSDPDFKAGLARIREATDPQVLRNMIAQNGRLRGQMGGRGEYADNVKQLDEQDKVAMERLRELGHVSFGSRTAGHSVVPPEGREVPEGYEEATCQTCGEKIVGNARVWLHDKAEKTSAVQALLEAEAAFFHAPQAPNSSPLTPKPPKTAPHYKVDHQSVDDNEIADETSREAVRRVAEDIASRLDGLSQNDDSEKSVADPVSTRPRVMPSDHSSTPGYGGMAANPDFAPVDPLRPTVGQRTRARVARLAGRIRADNPDLSDRQAQALAARTVAAYPEMVSPTQNR